MKYMKGNTGKQGKVFDRINKIYRIKRS